MAGVAVRRGRNYIHRAPGFVIDAPGISQTNSILKTNSVGGIRMLDRSRYLIWIFVLVAFAYVAFEHAREPVSRFLSRVTGASEQAELHVAIPEAAVPEAAEPNDEVPEAQGEGRVLHQDDLVILEQEMARLREKMRLMVEHRASEAERRDIELQILELSDTIGQMRSAKARIFDFASLERTVSESISYAGIHRTAEHLEDVLKGETVRLSGIYVGRYADEEYCPLYERSFVAPTRGRLDIWVSGRMERSGYFGMRRQDGTCFLMSRISEDFGDIHLVVTLGEEGKEYQRSRLADIPDGRWVTIEGIVSEVREISSLGGSAEHIYYDEEAAYFYPESEERESFLTEGNYVFQSFSAFMANYPTRSERPYENRIRDIVIEDWVILDTPHRATVYPQPIQLPPNRGVRHAVTSSDASQMQSSPVGNDPARTAPESNTAR